MTEIKPDSPPALKSFNARGGKEYPAPDTRLGRGWAYAWRVLVQAEDDAPGEFIYGSAVTEPAARAVRPHLHEVTLLNLMNRMVAGGILESEKRPVAGARGIRTRNFYRIKR